MPIYKEVEYVVGVGFDFQPEIHKHVVEVCEK